MTPSAEPWVLRGAPTDMTTGTVSSAGALAGGFVMAKDNVGRFPGNKLWGDGWGWSWFDAKPPEDHILDLHARLSGPELISEAWR